MSIERQNGLTTSHFQTQLNPLPLNWRIHLFVTFSLATNPGNFIFYDLVMHELSTCTIMQYHVNTIYQQTYFLAIWRVHVCVKSIQQIHRLVQQLLASLASISANVEIITPPGQCYGEIITDPSWHTGSTLEGAYVTSPPSLERLWLLMYGWCATVRSVRVARQLRRKRV
jgi:hypothetical protein